MKRILLLAPLSTAVVLAAPVIAQTAPETTTVPVNSQEPPALVNEERQLQEDKEGVGAASADSDRADLLPIRSTDLSPEHWAFEAVMNLYY